MTCCSTESSFLERRCSAITLGLSSLAPIVSRPSSRRASRDACVDNFGQYPGIHIIEATPKSSPCPSERQSHMIFQHQHAISNNAASSNKDHIKVLDRFKRRRHDDNSIDSISEYPDEVLHANNNGNDENENVSDNIVNLTSDTTTQQSHQHQQHHHQQSFNSNKNSLFSNSNKNNNNHHHHVSNEDGDMSQSNNNENDNSGNKDNNNKNGNNECERRAPLASLSSFKMSSAEYVEDNSNNGSVFDEVSCADTDDDLEQFSTDSDEISLHSPPSSEQHVRSRGSTIKCDNSVILVQSNATTLKGGGDSLKADDIERQQLNDKISTKRPVSYLKPNSDKKVISKSSECVAIVANEKPSIRRESSAVILEMPVLSHQDDKPSPSNNNDSETLQLLDPAIDLSLPGSGGGGDTGAGVSSNRKWSKETLF
jgi:hypothetical protein